LDGVERTVSDVSGRSRVALPQGSAAGFNIPAQMILRMLGAIAPPLILLAVMRALDIGFDPMLIVLHWIIAAVPLALFCKVTSVVGTQGFGPFAALGWFIVAVLIALALQATYYLVRVWLSSPVRRGGCCRVRGTRWPWPSRRPARR
jgi:hypothetical protein